MGTGADGSLKKTPTSYMKSLKNFPLRFRSTKNHMSLENKSGDVTPLANSREMAGRPATAAPAAAVPLTPADEELSTETDTVAPGKAQTGAAAANPKLVVRATMSQTPVESSEFSDPNTAPHLVYLTSYGGNMNYPLTRAETHVGRKDDNHIILTDATISKFHAIVYRKSEGITVVDRNSSNGVRVNDQFIQPMVPTPLRSGDTVMIGSIRLMYYENFGAIPKQTSKNSEDHLKLVTILPSLNSYDEKIAIKAEIEEENVDFKKVDLVTDINVLKEDYEKLRLAYELSKVTLTVDLSVHLEKALDLIFEILPVDRGVVLLVDQNTGTLATHQVKLRSSDEEGKEIVLSSTILKRVYESRKVLVTMDASQDKSLQAAASVMHSQMRTVICLPLVGHNKVHGIIHLDASDAISNFSRKDLSIVTAISNHTAIAIENSILMVEYEQNAKLKEQLSRFLAPHLVEKMSNPSQIIRKGGRQLVGSVIFVDIRGFTNMSEKSTPVEVVHLLNDYFERLVRIVFKYNGVVDKYIGDALMAVFGTLEDDQDAEFRAVSAAFEFKQAIKDMNEDRARFSKDPISIGVGVNTGDMLAGFIGSSLRLEYTVIGDNVNISSRICSMSSKNQILISEYTYEHVKDRVETIQIGPRQFKGKQNMVMVYEIISMTPKGATAVEAVAEPHTSEPAPYLEEAPKSSSAVAVVPVITPVPVKEAKIEVVVAALESLPAPTSTVETENVLPPATQAVEHQQEASSS